MPLPEPTDDETIQQFLDRCLADPHIQDEFPDHDQAMAVCMKQWNQDWDSADEHRDNSETTHQTYFASELRIDTRGKQRRIIGEIPYNSNSRDMGFIEFLRPGCFTDSLKKSDPPIVAFWNHNNDQILGSTANGTLKFQDSLRALRFEIIPPETSFSKDAISLISTGTVSGCSFSFNVRKEAWDKNLREVISADLHEISPCTMPAYPDTSVDVRSKITTHYGRSKNMSPKLRELFERKNKLATDMRSVLESRSGTQAERDATYQRMESNLDRVLDDIKAEERSETLARKLALSDESALSGTGVGNADSDFSAEDIQARSHGAIRDIKPGELRGYFPPEGGTPRITLKVMGLQSDNQGLRDVQAFLRGGRIGITEEVRQRFEKRALQADLDTAGGYLLTEQLSAQIVMTLENSVFIRRYATVILAADAASPGVPTLGSDPADANWTAEIKTGSEDDSMDFEARSLTPHPLAKRIKASKTLIRKAPKCEQIIRDRLAYKFAVPEERCFMQGTGSNQPLGLFTVSDAGIPVSRDVTAGNATAFKADDLINMKYNLKSQYRRNARWIVSREFVKRCRKLKDGEGNYLWKTGIASDRGDTILDLPFEESEYCPDTFTSGKYIALLGNLSYYWIVDSLAMQIQVLLELYAETNQNGYIGRKETDGMPILAEAFSRLKLA